MTLHAYATDQQLLDLPHKDIRRARSHAVDDSDDHRQRPTRSAKCCRRSRASSTASGMRVPTPNVSVVDLNAVLEKNATAEEINAAFKAASDGPLKGIMEYVLTAAPVSIDFRGNPHSASIDSAYTKVMGGDFAKIVRGGTGQRVGCGQLHEPASATWPVRVCKPWQHGQFQGSTSRASACSCAWTSTSRSKTARSPTTRASRRRCRRSARGRPRRTADPRVAPRPAQGRRAEVQPQAGRRAARASC